MTGAASTVGLVLFGALLLVHGALFIVALRFRRPHGRRLAPTAGADFPPRPLFSTTSRAGGWVLLAILAGAIVVRAIGLGEALWFDEIVTLVNQVRPPLADLLGSFESQNQHLLYTLVAKATTSLVGAEYEIQALRLPAAALGVASVWAVYRLGIRVGSETEALTAAGLLAFSYHHVWFSQNARGYTGLLLGTLLGTWLFLKILRDDGGDAPRWIGAYALTMALTAMIHLLAAAVVVAHGVVWAVAATLERGRERGWATWAPGVAVALAGTLSLQLYAPVLPQLAGTMLEPTMEGYSVAWTDPVWLLVETTRGLAEGLPGGTATLLVALLVAAVGLTSHARRDPLFTSLMVAPALVTLGVLLMTRHNLWPRLFFFSAGFGALILVRGVVASVTRLAVAGSRAGDDRAEGGRRFRAEWAARCAGVLLVAGSALTVPGAWGAKQDFAGAAALVDERSGPADTVVTVDLAAFPFLQYLKKDWETVESERNLERIEASDDTTWVVYMFPTRLEAIHPAIWRHLGEEHRVVARLGGTVRGGDLFVTAKE